MRSLTNSKTNYPIWSDQSETSLVFPPDVRFPNQKQDNALVPPAIMISTVPDMGLMGKLVKPLASSRSFYMGKLLMTSNGVVIAGPYMGAPYAVMLLESLIAGGISRIVVLGWCGTLDNELVPGDLVLPFQAIQDEGVSRHYSGTGDAPGQSFPGRKLSDDLMQYLQEYGESVHRKRIWTTDAVFRETPSKVNWFRAQGAQVVDMECSALFSVAAFHKIELAALLVVSDGLNKDSWNPGFSRKSFQQTRQRVCNHLLDFVQTHHESEKE